MKITTDAEINVPIESEVPMIGGYGVWDTHIHIVPGVDDGARTIEESLEMLKMEQRQGVDMVFATPHSSAFDYWPKKVHEAYEDLERAVNDAKLHIKLMGLGCEMFCHPGNVSECIRKIKSGDYPTFSRYVLTELPTYGIGIKDAIYCIDKIKEAGYVPVLAHVERYEFADTKNIAYLREKGALIQVNAYSLTAKSSADIRRFTAELVKFGMVDFTGSDAHRLDHRPPVMLEGVMKIIDYSSDENAMWILGGNPKQRLYRGD
ncbi:MAG: hypothetical protein J5959_09830 [Butyrivibrio sp.]|nr:hypothetical protein [Butyrivibrio sp.]